MIGWSGHGSPEAGVSVRCSSRVRVYTSSITLQRGEREDEEGSEIAAGASGEISTSTFESSGRFPVFCLARGGLHSAC
ncbi:hypothetical protein AGOR_G00116830 [Albula goreensis]|uniref:Uncharacterized protein n=1 Tax=Albula goreensis TaxID=1534307 RepID=A0A8T3DAK4_9TELE|nr:hypothetical protein AGOR_G00116830 [Albula goreensis]